MEAEKTKAAAATPPVQAYEQAKALATGELDKPEVRARVRESLRGFIDRIDVDVVGKTYTIRYKGSDDYSCVHLVKDSYYITGRTQERLPPIVEGWTARKSKKGQG